MRARVWTWALATAVLSLVGQPLAGLTAPGNAPVVAILAPVLAACIAALRKPSNAPETWAWTLLAVLGGLQVVRVATFRADETQRWGAAFPFDDLAVEHECLPAYIYAAELAQRGEDVYSPAHYPASATGTDVPISTDVRGMGPHIDDPYLYPPTFLLAPRAALALDLGYPALRSVVFGLNALLVLAVGLAVARHAGGPGGATSAKLLAALALSVPFALALQFGQFHLAAFALALGAHVCVERGRPALGGALLAMSIAGKLFPAVLLVTLVARRRWHAVAWTAGWSAALILIALWVFGSDVFSHFAEHWPRLANGEAADFVEGDPRAIGENGSFLGVFEKLEYLGVWGFTAELGRSLTLAYTLSIIGLAWWVGRRSFSRAGRAAAWLAILNLAALRSPYAPAAYAFAGGLWLLSLLAPRARGRTAIAATVCAWAVLNGIPPMEGHSLRIALSLLGPGTLFILCAMALLAPPAHPGGASGRKQS